jgi:hypothetical protein
LTCDAKALAVPAVVLMVSVASVLSDPPILGSLPNADLARFELDPESDLSVEPPFSSGSSMIPKCNFSTNLISIFQSLDRLF